MISVSAIERCSFVNQCIMAAVALFMAVVVSFFLGIKPQIQQLKDLQSQALDLKSDFESKQQSGGGGLVLTYRAQLQELERRFAWLLKQVSIENEMSSLTAAILKRGADSGITFEQFAPAAQVKEDGYMVLPIHMSVSGSFYQIVIFLKKIQRLKRLVSWHDFEIQRENKEEVRVGKRLQMTMLLKIYRNDL